MGNFRFEPGKLYIRKRDGEFRELAFENPDKQWDMTELLWGGYGEVAPSFGGYIECQREESGHSAAGLLITHHKATDEDLYQLMEAVDKNEEFSLHSWVKRVRSFKGLHPEEKERIIKIAMEIHDSHK